MTTIATPNTSAIDPSSAPLTDDDRAILERVEEAITQGQDLKKWWADENTKERVRLNRLPVARQINRPGWNYGFLLNADLRLGRLAVAGVIQDQIFDCPKAPKAARDHDKWKKWKREQLRTFVMDHFMSLTSTRYPAPAERFPGTGARESKADQTANSTDGWVYEQCYYKLKATGETGKFSDEERFDLISLLEVGRKYAWVVFKPNIHHFDIEFPLAGTANGPRLVISSVQPVYAVMTPDFLVDDEEERLDEHEPGRTVLGQYGYGYSVVPDPTKKSVIAVVPSAISNTIETLTFRVLDNGEVRAHMDFITPQPSRIINFDLEEMGFELADRLSFGMASKVFAPLKKVLEGFDLQLDPVYAAGRLANLATLGFASDSFSVNKEQLLRDVMTLHFTDVSKMFNIAGSHFGMVPDWTGKTEDLPDWAKRGTHQRSPLGKGSNK